MDCYNKIKNYCVISFIKTFIYGLPKKPICIAMVALANVGVFYNYSNEKNFSLKNFIATSVSAYLLTEGIYWTTNRIKALVE